MRISKILFAIVVVLACVGNLQAQAKSLPAAGIVFDDANGDGKLSEGEKGLAGVVVTDGMSVVKTDADGKFAFDATVDPMLKEGEKPIVQVSLPDGFVNSSGPWFVRLTADKAHDTSLTFALKKQEQKRPFDFVHVTDIHWSRNAAAYEKFRKDLAQAGAERYRFIVNTGDIGDWPDNSKPEWAWAQLKGGRAVIDNLPMPFWSTVGNHEQIYAHSLNYGWKKTDPGYGYDLYWTVLGPVRWSFTYAGVHFVGVDIMERPDDDEWFRGAPKTTLEWVQKDLAAIPKDMPVYMFGHVFDGNKWEPTLGKANFKAVFYGDGHEDRTDIRKGVPFIETTSLGQAARIGYRVVRIGKDGGFAETTRFPGEEQAIYVRQFYVEPKPKPTFKLRGYVYGKEIAKENVSVTVGDAPTEVAIEKPGELNTYFTATADLSAMPAGYHKVTAKAAWGKTTVSQEQILLNLYGKNDPYKGKVRLGLGLAGIDVPAEVTVNGQKVATVKKTRIGGDNLDYRSKSNRIMLDLPDGVLKRLNVVEIKPGMKDGKPDAIYIAYVWMEIDDGESAVAYRDLKNPGFGPFYMIGGPRYIDLKTPMPDQERFFELLPKDTEPQE